MSVKAPPCLICWGVGSLTPREPRQITRAFLRETTAMFSAAATMKIRCVVCRGTGKDPRYLEAS